MTQSSLEIHIPWSKRLFDLLLTIPLLIILSPILLILIIIVAIFMGRPIFFRQQRPGFQGKIFTLYKFRSMRNAIDADGNPLPDVQRLSWLGKFLRASSLDELPELFNVLMGQMSLVGPRPLLIEYLPLYSPEQARRHDVLPGMTGWAQINGRNAISWEKKFELDVWYVDHWSIGLDIKILWLTFFKVIRREGITQSGQATTEYFTGSASDANSEIDTQ
ncbi:MAG: sugar transferase [Anaerolineaceae bacterium]|nr:sugar transferase [Anaerolineaceae bacterium]